MAVARRAAELALASGVGLPDRPGALAAGRRPAGRARRSRASPRSSAGCSEGSFGAAARRRQGAHFTPASLATGIAERALAGRSECHRRRPCLWRRRAPARRRAPSRRPWRGSLRASWRGCGRPTSIHWPSRPPRPPWPCGRGHRHRRSTSPLPTGCLDDLRWPPLDVVVGNPPFLSQLGADDGARCRRRSPVARAVR